MDDRYFLLSELLEIESLRTREYSYPQALVFNSVVSALRDLGCMIRCTDRRGGLISAESLVGSDVASWFSVGVTNMTQTDVTAVIEEVGVGGYSRVRLNFVSRMRRSFGVNTDLEYQPLLDAGLYRNAFQCIERAISVRSGG